MKVFKDLEIEVPTNKRNEFLTGLERALPAGWIRDRKAEENTPSATEDIFYYFVCPPAGERLAALVALVARDDRVMYVSNIVPRDVSELKYDQYNYILDEFADKCVMPVADKMNLRVIRSSGQATLESWVSPDTAKKFHTFSALANKSTGTSHPNDKERWYEFIIAVVRNHDNLHSSSLARWLVEEDGWDADTAEAMAIEYEQEIGLLKHYIGK